MFVAAFIFVLSAAAMLQFAVLSWRAGLLRVAGQRFAGETEPAGAASADFLRTQDFKSLQVWREICPDLSETKEPSLSSVSMYFRILGHFQGLGNAVARNSSSGWAQAEMALCTRYAAVMLSARLERNRAVLAEVSSC
jgi:hypothetical protein